MNTTRVCEARTVIRLQAFLGASALAGALLASALLSPSPSGVGTHVQMGLPPCMALTLFGVPCPTCGCTTAWAFMAAGRPLAAWKANAFGALLFCAAAVLALALLWVALGGRSPFLCSLRARPNRYCLWLLCCFLASWILKLATWRGSFHLPVY